MAATVSRSSRRAMARHVEQQMRRRGTNHGGKFVLDALLQAAGTACRRSTLPASSRVNPLHRQETQRQRAQFGQLDATADRRELGAAQRDRAMPASAQQFTTRLSIDGAAEPAPVAADRTDDPAPAMASRTGPACTQAPVAPRNKAGISSTYSQHQTCQRAGRPATARARSLRAIHAQTSRPAPASASAENEIAPISASASVARPERGCRPRPAGPRARMPMRRCSQHRAAQIAPSRRDPSRRGPAAAPASDCRSSGSAPASRGSPCWSRHSARRERRAVPALRGLRASGKASTYRSDGTPRGRQHGIAGRASGRIGSAISSMYSGNSQRAVRTCRRSRHSTTPAWNWCGRVNMASAPSRISAGKPLAPRWAAAAHRRRAGPGRTPDKTPSASIARQLEQRLERHRQHQAAIVFGRADARRVPNNIANRRHRQRHVQGAVLPWRRRQLGARGSACRSSSPRLSAAARYTERCPSPPRGDRRGQPRTAAQARGNQVGQRSRVVFARQAQQLEQEAKTQQVQQNRANEGRRHPPARALGLGDRAVESPGRAVDRQRQA